MARGGLEEQDGNSTETFGNFCMDPMASTKGSNPPHYNVLNDIPLPFSFDNRGVVKGIFDCFNCGHGGHKVGDCTIPKDQNCININRNWMQMYKTSGNMKFHRKRRGKERYFETMNKQEEEADMDEEGEISIPQEKVEDLEKSELKIFDNIEEMPLAVEPAKMNKSQSITEMNQAEQNWRNRSRRNNYGNQNGGYRNNRQERNYNNNGNRGRGRSRGGDRHGGDRRRDNYNNNRGRGRNYGGYQTQNYQTGYNNNNYGQQNQGRAIYTRNYKTNPLDYGLDSAPYPSQQGGHSNSYGRGKQNNRSNQRQAPYGGPKKKRW